MHSAFRTTVVVLLLLGHVAVSHAQEACADVAACFAEALRGSRSLTITYAQGAQPSLSVCTPECKAYGVAAVPGPGKASFVIPANTPYGVNGQGYNSQLTTHAFSSGYATLPVYALQFPPKTRTGFTVAATVYAIEASAKETIFTMISDDPLDKYDAVFEAHWDHGRLVLERLLRRVTQLTDKPPPTTLDIPWDFKSSVIKHGVYPFRRTTLNEPTPRLIELYFRFRSDGKVIVDMATVNAEAPDQLITHIQDMGLYVPNYPLQPVKPPCPPDGTPWWCPPDYPVLYGVVAGKNVTQLTFFDHVLSDNEVLAFHANNVYYGGRSKPSIIAGQWHDHVSCNSGIWMNDNQTVHTVCGDRPGLGPASPEVQAAMAEPVPID